MREGMCHHAESILPRAGKSPRGTTADNESPGRQPHCRSHATDSTSDCWNVGHRGNRCALAGRRDVVMRPDGNCRRDRRRPPFNASADDSRSRQHRRNWWRALGSAVALATGPSLPQATLIGAGIGGCVGLARSIAYFGRDRSAAADGHRWRTGAIILAAIGGGPLVALGVLLAGIVLQDVPPQDRWPLVLPMATLGFVVGTLLAFFFVLGRLSRPDQPKNSASE